MKQEDVLILQRVLYKLRPDFDKVLNLMGDIEDYVINLENSNHAGFENGDQNGIYLDAYTILMDFRSHLSLVETMISHLEWNLKHSDTLEKYERLNKIFFRGSEKYLTILKHLREIIEMVNNG